MKRSEFKKWLDGELRYGFGGQDQKEETIIAKVEEIAGPVRWEPEEEPAPRLLLVAGAVIEERGSYRHVVAAPREAPGRTERNAKILADMFEAYNRVQEGGPEAVVIGRALYDDLCRAVALGTEKAENIQRCADRSDALVDRWKGVVERALAEVRHATPSFERIEAVLEERDPGHAAPREGAPDVITKTRRGRTVHYAVGPIRATREMAERDVRLFKVGVWDGDE